ncbi:ribonuclease H-like domain-containing protein [Mycena latifolia]|nr:ribonuclease H-like domain-containing protein [Mycena latifolia]
MAPSKSPLWKFFHRGGKKNSSHFDAYCLGCINACRPATEPIDVDAEPAAVLGRDWFSAALDQMKPVLGEKKAMIAHLIGGKTPCPNASKEAKSLAKKLRQSKDSVVEEQDPTDGDDESDGPLGPPLKRKRIAAVEKNFRQSQLKVFKGIDVEMIKTQFLRATISANLPFRWVINPEVINLFLMFRSKAGAVIPDRKTLAGPLLRNESQRVQENSYLIDVIHSNGQRKDGESMCNAFCAMIDKAEREHGCIVVCFCCDNDGGSQKGRKLLIIQRPWLFGPPCCAHQVRLYGQLILVDYFKENQLAEDTAESATELLGWIVGHEHVRDIFDKVQVEKNGKAVSYLIANITRWTTHFASFDRLIRLKEPLRQAAITKRAEIIAAHVGAEKNKKAVEKMTKAATRFCDLLDDRNFWKALETVKDDIEPICYITNINQGNKTRADHVLLGLAGVYLHFKRHADRLLAARMTERLEKRWGALDQPMFVFCLILNPYERLERFGPAAAANAFTLSTAIMELYRRVKSRPSSEALSDEQKAELQNQKTQKEAQVSKAFLQYLSSTGEFKHWEANRATFESINGDDPILVWEQFLPNPELHELADFAILLLGMVINQGGNERDFSDFKIKKTRLRNRLGFTKVGEMSKVGADIRASHMAVDGLFESREKRKNHADDRVQDLLSVPRYADALESGDEDTEDELQGRKRQVLVKTKQTWRKVHASWVIAAREADLNSDEEMEDPEVPATGKWLPMPLSKLFGEDAPRPVDHRTRRRTFDREQLLMELLAAEHSDEEPDDGELEGSGDDYAE